MENNFFNLDNPDFWRIMFQFGINLVFLFIYVRLVYFRYSKKEKYVFSFFLMGIMIFFIGSMLKAVYIEIGIGFALFGIFTILRFRSKSFSIKDMAYMFTTIGVSLINSLKLAGFPYLGIFIFNAIIIISAIILEEFIAKNKSDTHCIVYENLELLKPDKYQRLLKDISVLTGKEILRVKIRRIDYKREVALLDIYFRY
jgi:hypothetical protein